MGSKTLQNPTQRGDIPHRGFYIPGCDNHVHYAPAHPVLHAEHPVSMYLAERAVSAGILLAPGRRGEDHTGHHCTAVILRLHAAGG